MNNTLKKCLPDILAVILFAIIAFVYFMPADLDGRILYRHDSSAGRGAGEESIEYKQKTGKQTRWTNSIFSGMPTYQMSPSYDSQKLLKGAEDVYHLWLPENVWLVFAYLLGFYILLRAFDFRQYLAVLGSIIWAFSSYFFIIIAAGHIWKVMALAYLPPMIAGIVLAYRGKYLWGLIVTAIFTAFEINANHVQMTYYYLFIIIAMVIAYLAIAIKQHKMADFLKATGVCIVGALVGLALNLSTLYHTYEYAKDTMRGKSELVKKNSSNQTSSGLDRDYVTQWSYGIGETWTLLIPNTKGGASVPMSQNAKAMEKADPQYLNFYQQIGQYWGEQPGTSGPVYVGAFVMLLFILGLFVVKGPMKWALLFCTVLSILLSWGKNFMPLTNFFLDYIPMYAKFRTVASILVIAEFTIPLLAVMTLKKIIDDPTVLQKKMRYVWLSFALTGGICVLFALMPNVFFSDFISSSEMQQFNEISKQGAEATAYMSGFEANLRAVRESIFTSDCWRSFGIIVVGMVFLLLYKYRKLSAQLMVVGITVLCLLDMWLVNKRYLNDDMFVEKSEREMPQPKTAADEFILQDKNLDYRVLNFASNTFNENETSYYHKSIGGYHPAKLRRYQELIEAYIAPEMQKTINAIGQAGGDMTQVAGDSIWPVLNMLNAKYFILPLQGDKTMPIQNPYVYGNAWFVDKINYVSNANEELDGIGKCNLRHEAVADKKFESTLGQAVPQGNVSVVKITAYEPNQLAYEVQSDKGGVLVFSEIYYPGWTAKVDGKPVEVGRVNYVLRAIHIAPGNHKVELDFFPKSIDRTETVAYVGYLVLFLLIAFGLWSDYRKRKQARGKTDVAK
jgi:hypothetical protein